MMLSRITDFISVFMDHDQKLPFLPRVVERANLPIVERGIGMTIFADIFLLQSPWDIETATSFLMCCGSKMLDM